MNSQRNHRGRGKPYPGGFVRIEYLQELGLLCGGIAVIMCLLLLTREPLVPAENLTTACKEEAAGNAQPRFPVYRLCVLADQQTAWVRRGRSSLLRVSITDGDVLEKLPVFASYVSASAHSLDGRVHAYSTALPEVCLTVVRDGVTCIEEHFTDRSKVITPLAVSADGSRVAVSKGRHGITIWNLGPSPPGQVEVPVESAPTQMSWSNKGDLLLVACVNGLVKLLSSDGHTVWERRHLKERMTSVAWAPDGNRVAVGCEGGEFAVLSAITGEVLWQSRQNSMFVAAVSFSTDGKLVATAGFDRCVKIHSAENGRLLATMWGHYDTITALQFLSDGDRILSGSLDGTLRIWSLRERRELQKL